MECQPLPPQDEYQWVNWLAVILFSIVLVFFIYMSTSGIAWVILAPPVFAYGMIIVSFLLAVAAGGIATYSFVSFSQSREIRNLMLMLLGIDIVIWSLLFLITHPSSSGWSILLADRERNRTLGMAFVLIVVPTIILGSFSGDTKSSPLTTTLLVAWGGLVIPLISFWFLLSPNPVFLMTSPEGGVEGLTPEGMIISFGFLIAQIIAGIRFAQKWWKTRDTLDLSLFLALLLWITGTFFIIILWDPFQIAELLWVMSIITGFLLISAVQFVISILQPHKTLENLVEHRTGELESSQRESEYYLNMWTHKIGNLLQGLVTYLELLKLAAQGSEDDRDIRIVASDLSREASLVNHQVLQLTQIKESLLHEPKMMGATKAIKEAIESANDLLGEDVFTINLLNPEECHILVDENLHIIFLNAILFHIWNRLEDEPVVSILSNRGEKFSVITIKSRGRKLSPEIIGLFESKEISGDLPPNLDLYAIKLLMNRYGGRVELYQDESNETVTLSFEFKSQ